MMLVFKLETCFYGSPSVRTDFETGEAMCWTCEIIFEAASEVLHMNENQHIVPNGIVATIMRGGGWVSLERAVGFSKNTDMQERMSDSGCMSDKSPLTLAACAVCLIARTYYFDVTMAKIADAAGTSAVDLRGTLNTFWEMSNGSVASC